MDMLPVPSRPENEQYEVTSRIEIIALLRELIASRTHVTVYYDGPNRFALTTVLAVNPEFEEIVLDASADPHDTDALLRASLLTVVALLDHVKVQFHASRAERIAYEGGTALRIRLPEAMLRLQRRNFYRIATPVARPLELTVPAGEEWPKPLTLRVVDLSCGGLGVAYQPPIRLELGWVLADCRLDLPEAGTIVAPLEVRFLMNTAGPGGTQRTRCGLQFVTLPGNATTLLQRYINKLERDRRSRS
jgi:c-di-GMP-binding flagellar brake protein YcgR